MDILTTASQSYIKTFSGFVDQFISWGQELFFILLSINIAWMCLWYAFDKSSIAAGLSAFLKKFAMILIFYTIMVNPAWLMELLRSVVTMGTSLTHFPVDPSSIINSGIALGNKIISPVSDTGLLTGGFSLIFLTVVYGIILYVFVNIALDLALTMIITSALISMSSFFLGFSALGATSQIARNTLDVILGNCVKLLGIYLVVAAGSNTITTIATHIPTTAAQIKSVGLDPYIWLVAATLLFNLVAKNLPSQLARIISISVHENHGTDAAALALTALNIAKNSMPALKAASTVVSTIGKLAGSVINNAGAHFNKMAANTGSLAASASGAVGGAGMHLGKAAASRVADQFKHIANKMAGGQGTKAKLPDGRDKPFASISERVYQSTQNVKASMQKKGS